MFQNQKDLFVPDIMLAEEIKESVSMELNKWSKNMVNVENCQFLKRGCDFLLVT